jgi:hypothetical protein
MLNPDTGNAQHRAFQQNVANAFGRPSALSGGRSPESVSASGTPVTAQAPATGSTQAKPRRRGTVLTDPLGLTPETGPSKTLLTA